jgi:hypothetical protein
MKNIKLYEEFDDELSDFTRDLFDLDTRLLIESFTNTKGM